MPTSYRVQRRPRTCCCGLSLRYMPPWIRLNDRQNSSRTQRTRRQRRSTIEVLVRLKSPSTPLPAEIQSVLTQQIDGIYDLIRRTRNEAGHPTGRRMERDETHALLLLFPTYCKTVHELMEWLATNKI